jgi:putative oxygen-independent coproporphyrinogen III oxidase
MPAINTSVLRSHPEVSFSAQPPLSLYVHIPWCVRKCPYCDFNSHELRAPAGADAHARALDPALEAQYAEALIGDLEYALPQIWGRRVMSVFFGGGTPSLLSASTLDQILAGIRARVQLDPAAEVTLEANPGTFEAEKFAQFRALGINRLSIGIQSFNPRHLHALGRIHDDAQARHAIEIARASFDNINLDLMYALPEQTLLEAEADICTAVDFAPAHISAYHLTIEPNTYFARFPPAVPDDDHAAQMQEMIERVLAESGYAHYETSAFARAGHRCRHNLNYWLFGDYLGIGAGAHSKLSFADRIVRQMRWKNPRDYLANALAGHPVQTEQPVYASDVPFEFMMNALRLIEGFDTALFAERTGLPLTSTLSALNEAERRGLIVRDHAKIAPTLRGQRFLNDLLQIFMPESTGNEGMREGGNE